MHWRLDLLSRYPACGAKGSLHDSTSCMAEVTCAQCRATIQAYLETLKIPRPVYSGGDVVRLPGVK